MFGIEILLFESYMDNLLGIFLHKPISNYQTTIMFNEVTAYVSLLISTSLTLFCMAYLKKEHFLIWVRMKIKFISNL